jgi:hypothetical protein
MLTIRTMGAIPADAEARAARVDPGHGFAGSVKSFRVESALP